MADNPVAPVGGKAPLPAPKEPAKSAPSPPASQTTGQAPLGGDPSALVSLSDTARGVAGDGVATSEHPALDGAASLFKDLAEAVGKLQKALFRLMHRLEKLQEHAQKIADKFFDQVSHDITAGRFEDYTHGQAVSTLIDQFVPQGGDAEQGEQRSLDDLARDAGAGRLLDESQASALAISYSQSISLSVKSVEITYQDGDSTVSLSYQSISFSVTTTIGAVFAQSDPQVIDANGNTVDTAPLNNGVFFDAKLESVADIIARLRAGDAGPGADAGGDPLQGLRALLAALRRFGAEGASGPGAGDAVFGALNTLLLIRQATFTQTVTGVGVTRILLDAATQVGAGVGGATAAAPAEPAAGGAPLDLQV